MLPKSLINNGSNNVFFYLQTGGLTGHGPAGDLGHLVHQVERPGQEIAIIPHQVEAEKLVLAPLLRLDSVRMFTSMSVPGKCASFQERK